MSNFSLLLHPLQLQVLRGIQKSAFFKKRLIARTVELEVDAIFRLDHRYFKVKQVLGSGLISVVYEVEDMESGESFALKRSRSRSTFFSEALRLEKEVTDLMLRIRGALGVVPIIQSNNEHLLKSYCTYPTLQAILFKGEETDEQRAELEKCLLFCCDLEKNYRLLLDLSAKNIVWNGNQWLLIDAGPKIHQSEFSQVAKTGTWESYIDYINSRVTNPKSEPSVLTKEDLNTPDLSHDRWVFIKEWWDWFPLDKEESDAFFFCTVSTTQVANEIIYSWDARTNQSELLDSLGNHPLIQRIAKKSWSDLFDKDLPEGLLGPTSEWLFDYQNDPIDWEEFVSEIRPVGMGKRLKELFPSDKKLPLPTLEVVEYRHWRDIFNQPEKHTVTDIFCHNPLPVPRVLNRPELNSKLISLTSIHSTTFCELEVFGSNTNGEAILIIPGFRATRAAAYELIRCLDNTHANGHYIVVEIGALNPAGQKLVTAGRWELILLWEIIEYCTRSLDINTVDIVAASHGAIGAWFVSCIHPAVRKVALDSPLLQPMKIIGEMTTKRNESLEAISNQLELSGMPSVSYSVFDDPPSNIDVLTIRPEKDLFGQLCGELQVGKCLNYKGGHASTLRHDSGLIGIPSLCIDALSSFLG